MDSTFLLQQFEHWLKLPVGQYVMTEESKVLTRFQSYLGDRSVLLGSNQQLTLLDKLDKSKQPILMKFLMGRYRHISACQIEMNEPLPLLQHSCDSLILPHVLEYVNQTDLLLSECNRVIAPGGYCFILGFNPYSLWGIKRYCARYSAFDWQGRFHCSFHIAKSLQALGFTLRDRIHFCYAWPNDRLSSQDAYKADALGPWLWPWLGGAYMLVMQKQTQAVAPLQTRWSDRLSALTQNKGNITEPTTNDAHRKSDR